MSEKQIDPGNEVSKVKPHTLQWIIDFVRKWPEATLARGEAGLLVDEIERLRAAIKEAQSTGPGAPSSTVEKLRMVNLGQ